MNDSLLRKILHNAETIAVVGCSSDPDKPGHFVPEYLMEHGYHIIPVNPTATVILDQQAYPDLLSVPGKVDVVEIFRPSGDVPPIVEQAIHIGAKAIWMQLGIENPPAAERARAAGLDVIMDHCMMIEHKRLIGEKKNKRAGQSS